MKIEHITLPGGRPLTIAISPTGTSRLPGHLTPQQVQTQLNIYRALDAQQRKAPNGTSHIQHR